MHTPGLQHGVAPTCGLVGPPSRDENGQPHRDGGDRGEAAASVMPLRPAGR